ncbi:MAG: hypothetical protein F4051_05985, partial [Boseongicola sp. SB0670_bin_30]|nr:hypothetical protein [Boseongicola sp. SB0670_bin_30]
MLQLVTTNFDNRFVEAGLHQNESVHAAPSLPVPKRHDWSGLVHLHGRISEDEDGSRLVLTAADLGRAYLMERWASRFVTELFREFTVVFVGYRVNDRVIRYLLDALAAERAKGDAVPEPYAFADWDRSKNPERETRDMWLAKKVEPIIYEKLDESHKKHCERDEHRLLRETLIQWADLRRDLSRQVRFGIALDGLVKAPGDNDDPVVERVLWALDDAGVASGLASQPPIMDESEFPKLGKWFDVFLKGDLQCCYADELDTGFPFHGTAVPKLVDMSRGAANPESLDATRQQLSVWLAQHLHVPQLLASVIRKGGQLHPFLRQEVRKRLADSDIHARLRMLWTVLLDSRPTGPLGLPSGVIVCPDGNRTGERISDHYRAAESDAERRQIEEEVVAGLAPQLIVRPGPPPRSPGRECHENNQGSVSPIDECGHLELTSDESNVRRWARVVLKDREFLARHAETLTGHLEHALSLGERDDAIPSDSSRFRPSIAPTGTHHPDGWTHLIDLAREGYLALADSTRARAEDLLLRWTESPRPLLRRMALDALTEDVEADIRLSEGLLLAERRPGLWDLEMRPEALRFLREASTRLPGCLRTRIVDAIRDGPCLNGGLGPFNSQRQLDREKSLRLYELGEPGGTDPRVRVEELGLQDLVAALSEEGVGQDEVAGLASRKPVRFASALRCLALKGSWPASSWKTFLSPDPDPMPLFRGPIERSARLDGYVASILAGAPCTLHDELANSSADFVNSIAATIGTEREAEFQSLWKKAWSGTGATDNDAAAKLAEAAVARLRLHSPAAESGIPASVRSSFDTISEDPCGKPGRVVLAEQLPYLFEIDGDWAAERLIARLSPAMSDEAADLWSAYARSNNGPSRALLIAFKEQLLEILQERTCEGVWFGKLLRLFISVCLDSPAEFSGAEIRLVMQALPEEGLKTVLKDMKIRLKSKAPDQGQFWRESVYPWLLEYWPEATDKNTAGTSEVILEMMAECGDAFPEAADWSLEFLRPLESQELLASLANPGRFEFAASGHATQHPEATIRVLAKVLQVHAGLLQGIERTAFRKMLDALVLAQPDMDDDERMEMLRKVTSLFWEPPKSPGSICCWHCGAP